MNPSGNAHFEFLREISPFDRLAEDLFEEALASCETRSAAAEKLLYQHGEEAEGLFLPLSGKVEIAHFGGERLALIERGGMFGVRAMLRGGRATNRARVIEDCQYLLLPRTAFERLMTESAPFSAHFDRRERPVSGHVRPSIADGDLTTTRLADIMTPEPVTLPLGTSVRDAARTMRDRDISCVLVVDGSTLCGILTSGDITNRIVAEGQGFDEPVDRFMTVRPFSLPSSALGFDAFLIMTERRFGHLPVVDDGRIVGILTRTNIIRRRSVSAVTMIAMIARRHTVAGIGAIVETIPQLLGQLVSGGAEPLVVGRLVTGVADATARRLLRLAEAELGPPPVPYLWAACGSQGRMEQTGVSDQDNCLIIDDRFDEAQHGAWFEALAQRVSTGLDACGYVFCPGEMMATNPKWRQPLAEWKRYFSGWIDRPDPMAQMLSSVMFDLRAIHGNEALLDALRAETLARARANTIFMAHLTANSLKHAPPLGIFGGISTPRTGEHKGHVDLKHAGVVPIVDLGRIYALRAGVAAVNTHERIEAGRDAGVISKSGAADLLDAYELICDIRLQHQARQARHGRTLDNHVRPDDLSELERGHLRDAFVVVRTMQAAAGQGQHMMS